MLYPRFIVAQKWWLQILQICCAAKKRKKSRENINARISYLPAAAAVQDERRGKERDSSRDSSSCWVFHLPSCAGIVCQTQNFVFSHSRRRRHVRGLWIITLKTAETRKTERKSEEEAHNLCERRFYRTFYFAKLRVLFFCLHTLTLCLFLHNFLLSLVQCIFHFVLTWPALTPARKPGQRTPCPLVPSVVPLWCRIFNLSSQQICLPCCVCVHIVKFSRLRLDVWEAGACGCGSAPALAIWYLAHYPKVACT